MNNLDILMLNLGNVTSIIALFLSYVSYLMFVVDYHVRFKVKILFIKYEHVMVVDY